MPPPKLPNAFIVFYFCLMGMAACLCITCVPNAHLNQGMLDPLELGLQGIINYHVGNGY